MTSKTQFQVSPVINWAEVMWVANACLSLYRTPEEGFDQYIGYHSCLAATVKRYSTCYVLFQGTNELADWAVNLRLRKQQVRFLDDYVLAHRGFTRIVLGMLSDIRAACKDASRVVFAGHSLGGALATLVAYAMAEKEPTVYTFGQPKVGNRELARRINERLPNYHRFHYVNDIVSSLPVGWCYSHSGCEHYITVGGNIVDPKSVPFRVLLDRFAGLVWHYLVQRQGLHTIKSHTMESYAKAITAYTQSLVVKQAA